MLHEIRRNDDEIRRQLPVPQNHVFNDIRSEVYVSGTYVRDYLLEPEPESAETYRASLEQVHKQMESALESYRGRQSPRPSGSITQLFAESLRIIGKSWLRSSNGTPRERRTRGTPFSETRCSRGAKTCSKSPGRIANINEQQLRCRQQSGDFAFAQLPSPAAPDLTGRPRAELVNGSLHPAQDSEIRRPSARAVRGGGRGPQPVQGILRAPGPCPGNRAPALSRELHDEVGQSLSAVLVELRNLSSGLAVRSEEQSRRQVETIKGLVEGTVRVVRNMALLLRPSMLDDLGLVPALKWQAREVVQAHVDGRKRRHRS